MSRGLDACKRCGADITHRADRCDRQWCSKVCAIYYEREQRRVAARLRRPRCVMCPNPLPYGKSGFVLTARCCSKACHIKYDNWFRRGKTSAA